MLNGHILLWNIIVVCQNRPYTVGWKTSSVNMTLVAVSHQDADAKGHNVYNMWSQYVCQKVIHTVYYMIYAQGFVLLCFDEFLLSILSYPYSTVHGANMGPIWGWQDPGGPRVGPMNFAIWVIMIIHLPISFSIASLAVGLLYACPSASEVNLKNMDKIIWYPHSKFDSTGFVPLRCWWHEPLCTEYGKQGIRRKGDMWQHCAYFITPSMVIDLAKI